MKRLFTKRRLWVADKELLVDRLYQIAHSERKPEQDTIKDQMYWLLDEYNIYRSPKNKKSTPLFRLTLPLFYLGAILCFIITQPIFYVIGKSIENTKLGYFFRAWESRL